MGKIKWNKKSAFIIVLCDNIKEDQIQRLKTELKSKESILAYMTHHVRTPLNTIVVTLNMLRKRNEKLAETAENQMLQPALLSANILLKRIRALEIYYSFPETEPEIILSTLDFSEFISNVYKEFHYQTKHKGLQFIIDIDGQIPSKLKTDELLLRIILFCLLENALQFTFEGFVKM